MSKMYQTKVDFSYSFGAPHRLCICLPEASKKSLLDCSESGVTLSWSDMDLTTVSLGAFNSPKVSWWFDVNAEVDGKVIQGKSWKRIDNCIPALDYKWEDNGVSIQLKVVAGKDADILKFSALNSGSLEIKAGVYGKTKDYTAFNMIWIDPQSTKNALLAHLGDRSDRVLLFAKDLNRYSSIRSPMSIDIVWNLAPGKEETAYIIRPHFALIEDLEGLLLRDWEKEMVNGLDMWKQILQRAPKFILPDPIVVDAYYACLADLFVTREKQSDGNIAGTGGTEIYRSMNTCEPAIAAIALDQAGFHDESEYGMSSVLSLQEENGRWDDYRCWGHDMWYLPGYKCWAIREHYYFTHDRKYLADCFVRMLAHARWSNEQRQKTKIYNKDGSKPLTWGLMPRGMGDGGLVDDGDFYGVFIPSNVWHCFSLKIALWAALELGYEAEEKQISMYYNDSLACTLDAIERGSITEKDGSRWIPGVPGKTSGSHFLATSSVYPCGILDPFHPLADGTIKKLESDIREGGIPIDLGWMKGGLWVSIALDNLSYAHLTRGEEDAAAAYMYPTLNHSTPLFSWCEERMPQPGTNITSGDRQHIWTPISIVRFIRDSLLMEDLEFLHIARAIQRDWLEVGNEIEVRNAPTFYGKVNYSLKRLKSKQIEFQFDIDNDSLKNLILHIRIPEKFEYLKVDSISGCKANLNDDKVEIFPMEKNIKVELSIVM